jgi:zinc transport system permease protein
MTGWEAFSWPLEWLRYGFMRQALAAVLMLGVLYGMLGSITVSAQMSFFSDAIGHAALTGIAIGVLLGLGNPVWAMAAFAVVLALAIVRVQRMAAASADTIIGLFMALAVALGVVLLSRGGGFAKYTRYLIGDILGISRADLWRLAGLTAASVAFLAASYNRLLLSGFNRPLAKSRGVREELWQGAFAALVAGAVSVSIQWVGLLVINSLLILPAAAARNLAQDSRQYLWLAVGISLVSGVIGLLASYYWATASGATIVIVAMGFFLISLAIRRR